MSMHVALDADFPKSFVADLWLTWICPLEKKTIEAECPPSLHQYDVILPPLTSMVAAGLRLHRTTIFIIFVSDTNIRLTAGFDAFNHPDSAA